MASSAVRPPAPQQLSAHTETAKNSKLASLLGTWAWQKQEGAGVAAKDGTSTDKTSEQPKQGYKK